MRNESHFLALVSFLARSKPKVPFLGLSLLRNQTETLATQANTSFSLTCLVTIQISRNTWKFLHEKRVQSSQDFLGTLTWLPFRWPLWRQVTFYQWIFLDRPFLYLLFNFVVFAFFLCVCVLLLLLLFLVCSSRKYPYPLPPHGGQRKFRGGGGSKNRQFPRGWGVAYRGFCQGV